MIWTVTATAQMAALNVLTYLTAYLDACGRNGGKPLTGPDLERFLPWNAGPEDLQAWHSHPISPAKPVPGNHHRRRPCELATPTIAMPTHRTSEYLHFSSSSLAERSMLNQDERTLDFKQHNTATRINSSANFTAKLTSVPLGVL